MEEDLKSHFERSANSVRSYAASFENSVAQPTVAFFHQYPVLTLFIAVWSLLGFVPVVTFILFASFLLISAAISAFSCALIASLFLFACLCFVLVVNLCISALFTTMIFMAYASFRFVFLVRSHGFGGISEWAAEVSGHVYNVRHERKVSDGGSDSSVVVISNETPNSHPIKSEG